MLKTEFKQKMSEVLPLMSIMETTEGELIGIINNGVIFTIKLHEEASCSITNTLTYCDSSQWFKADKLIKEFVRTPVAEREPQPENLLSVLEANLKPLIPEGLELEVDYSSSIEAVTVEVCKHTVDQYIQHVIIAVEVDGVNTHMSNEYIQLCADLLERIKEFTSLITEYIEAREYY